MKLDLACGQTCRDGFTGVDIAPGPGVKYVIDLFTTPWGFDTSSADEVYCSHFVEHTPNLIAFMEELYRVLRPGATATIIAPYYMPMRAWQDPTHTRAITDATFLYFDAHWREREGLSHYPIHCDFEVTGVRHYWNVIEDIQVTLTSRKRETYWRNDFDAGLDTL